MRSTSSSRAVIITMGTGDAARIARQTSNPSISGSITSSRTRSGSWARASVIASRPVRAIVASYPSLRRLYDSVSARLRSSSTTRIRATSRGDLAETPGDIVLSALVPGFAEYLTGLSVLHELANEVIACQHERCVIGDACRLLHVVSYDHHGVLGLEIVHQLFDLVRRDRVERRCGL